MSAKSVMAIESRKIDSRFHIGWGRSINSWKETVDSNPLRCVTIILGWMLKDGQKKNSKCNLCGSAAFQEDM